MNSQTVLYDRLIISFPQLSLQAFDIPKFRGYLANIYPEYSLLHNHLAEHRFRYGYPMVQFKIMNTNPIIVGIGDGVDVLKKVFLDIRKLDINGRQYTINEKSIVLDLVRLGRINQPVSYQFLLPWMALNQRNYESYCSLTWEKKRGFLENILKGNLKSLSKGFDYFIPEFEALTVRADLKSIQRNFKNNRMLCFEGSFQTNFLIPDFLGLGKQTARGFGTVKRMDL